MKNNLASSPLSRPQNNWDLQRRRKPSELSPLPSSLSLSRSHRDQLSTNVRVLLKLKSPKIVMESQKRIRHICQLAVCLYIDYINDYQLLNYF